MPSLHRRRIAALLLVAVALLAAAAATYPYLHGLSFVIRVADMSGAVRRAADLDTVDVRESLVTIPLTPGQSVRARVFQPARSRRAVLVVSGLNPAGIDEPRLVALARQLSASNVTIVTPDIPELAAFEVTPALTDAIERSAAWLASRPDLAPDGRVGMIGISFSGGLSIVAAGRPALAGKVAYVFALGGHHDLPRVLAYLCMGAGATAERPPHEYGAAVVLLGVADRVVPPDQVEPLRIAVRRFLGASQLARSDAPLAEQEFAALRVLAAEMAEPSATLLKFVNDRDVGQLGPRLLPHLGGYGEDPALSPSRSPKLSAPVFLLHGIEDNVIPASESQYLAQHFERDVPVRLLVTGLISHAEIDNVRVQDVIGLAAFAADLLSR